MNMNTKTLPTRRKFFWQAGAVLSAPLTAAAANASEDKNLDNAKIQLAALKDVNAIRDLQQNFIHHLNSQDHETAQLLFHIPKKVKFDKTITSLSPNTSVNEDYIELALDGKSATSIAHYVAQFETPLADCSLVEMARQQGEGVHRFSEDLTIESEYLKQGTIWKIKQSKHLTV